MPAVQDHPLRYQLSNELHARPFPTINVPGTAVFLALKPPKDAARRDRDKDFAHLISLLDRHGAPHPQPGATHYFGDLGRYRLKWESHTEFVTYTVFSDHLSARAYDPADFEVFPDDWLKEAPGERITSAMIRIEPLENDGALREKIQDWFVPDSVAVSKVLNDAAVIVGDFHIDPAGHQRFLVAVAADTGPRRVGRVVQRLCEIETYKAMSMLGFARARELSADMGRFDGMLSDLITEMSDEQQPAEDTLHKLLNLSAEVETMTARMSFRFGATKAYEKIVHERITVLREARFEGRQSFAEFMMRRYDPAMRTVRSVESRLIAMSERALRAGDLLRTRVDVERSAQNQALLESMDRRADLQLRLQHTVEGLSVVAISYYAVSLVSYLLYPLAGAVGISKGLLTALVVLPVVGFVWWMTRRIRKKLH